MSKTIQDYCIYGVNGALGVLNSKSYIISSIFIMNDSIASNNIDIVRCLKDKNYHVTYLDKTLFLKKFDFKHTQGIIISFTGKIIYEFNDEQFLNDNICYVILDQINDPQNLGQIIRTCACSGIDGIILPKHGSVHITNTVLQVSQGAFTKIKFFVVTNIANVINQLKNDGFWIIGVENDIDSKAWHTMDYLKKIGIVFGSEGKGIRKLVMQSCDFLTTVPMMNGINSLNISAAVSAIVFERYRQIEIKESLKN